MLRWYDGDNSGKIELYEFAVLARDVSVFTAFDKARVLRARVLHASCAPARACHVRVCYVRALRTDATCTPQVL